MTSLVAGMLEKEGPLTGKELVYRTGLDVFGAWKTACRVRQVQRRIVGRRYLRLDRKVEGYARLSPSIMREFLNYTLVGLSKDLSQIEARAGELEKEIARISRRKINLARDTVRRLVENSPGCVELAEKCAFIIAGDVVFGMGHAEPRPESSTGEMVRGSDLDIIAVCDGLSPGLREHLDSALYREKYNLLKNPAQKEEIDYIIKDLGTVRGQLRFEDFKAMVASKILHEGEYLCGSMNLFERVKQVLSASAVPGKLADMEARARLERNAAEAALLEAGDEGDEENLMALFFTTEEKEEIF